MKLGFLPEARAEFFEAANYYEGKETNLGQRFRNEVGEVCSAILDRPGMWRERAGGFRKVNCPVFPYYIAYYIRGDQIVIAAVAHASRHPDFWRQRIQ